MEYSIYMSTSIYDSHQLLQNTIAQLHGITQHVWYADNAQAAGKLHSLRLWWDRLVALGPKYGYYPKAAKTFIIVKPSRLTAVTELFSNTGIQFSSGERDLGAAIGMEGSVMKLIDTKVSKWTKEIKELSTIAKCEPHAAHAAFVHGLRHRWSFIQRTMPDIGARMTPLEESIRHDYIPSLIGRTITDIERDMLALPARLGGAAIDNPTISTSIKFNESSQITKALADLIIKQDPHQLPSSEMQAEIKGLMRKTKNARLTTEANSIIQNLPEPQSRAMYCAQEKGTSAIITAKPIKRYGFALQKSDFRDAMLLRYNWPIPNLPSKCHCGQKYDLDHSQICKLGGFVHMRHNDVRDLFATLTKTVVNDVEIEPPLQPLTGEHIQPQSANTSDDARSDIRARGFWQRQQNAFFDVRISYPNAKCYRTRPLQKCSHHWRKRKNVFTVIELFKSSTAPSLLWYLGQTAAWVRKHRWHSNIWQQ